MTSKYLLYIDILGFSNLVDSEPGKVDDLFRVIASLNAMKHHAFEVVVFSDTVLAYNRYEPRYEDDHRYFVMFLCEFVQDLMHRLVGRDIAFRAVLTYGQFDHYFLNAVSCFYGPALIHAYQSEKALKSVGLFIDAACQAHNTIFSVLPFNPDWSFVFVTQALDQAEDLCGGEFPLPRIIVEDTGLGWFLGAEILMLRRLYEQATSHPSPDIAAKYSVALALYRQRYPRTLAFLERTHFSLEAVSREFDWSQVERRHPQDFSWASVRRPPGIQ